ncbi:MAG: SDR family NAD(P)-dependent oxidoreductase, partial [Methylovulum sp.]
APNGAAQEALICEVYRKYRINPEQIGYVEAHGTGTRLGDPVEANALARAFKQFTDRKQYCAIGSAKAHIGHTSASAGVIGLIRILMSMRHGRIPGLLHFKQLNPLIEFGDSAFYINTEAQDWRRTGDRPLMAALNSFGHSGTNVHLVVSEYRPQHAAADYRHPALVPLSAKDPERLHDMLLNLHAWLSAHRDAVRLHDIAYTLQTGREAMTDRIIFIVDDVAELIDKLQAVIDGQTVAHCFSAQLDGNRNRIPLFAADEDSRDMVEKWLAKGKLDNIAELWLQGIAVDWHGLYQTFKPQRIHLPGYPFAKEHYRARREAGQSQAAHLHPLLHSNTSDLLEQRYSSIFTGHEFFLADHRIAGQKLLPGVVYLEMARAAVEQAGGRLDGRDACMQLEQIVWARPLAVADGVAQTVHIALFPEDGGRIRFDIYTDVGRAVRALGVEARTARPTEPVLHSSGTATFSTAGNPPDLDLADLQARINQRRFSGEECYKIFKSLEIDYGLSFQGLESLDVGHQQVLAKLRLPATGRDQFVLHPSLMDSALQAVLGLAIAGDGEFSGSTKPMLPFALAKLVIERPCTDSMWAWVRDSAGSTRDDNIRKLDIDLCDEQGRVCVQMQGFSARVLDGVMQQSERIATLMRQPAWQDAEPVVADDAADYAQHWVMLYALDRISATSIEAGLEHAVCVELQTAAQTIEKRYQDLALQLFARIKQLIADKAKGRTLVQLLIPGDDEQVLMQGLAGLFKTAHLEYPDFFGQIIAVDRHETGDGLLAKIIENRACPDDVQLRYRNQRRQTIAWRELPAPDAGDTMPWRDHGVYLITGGLGGLGLIFAKDIAAKVRNPALILTGRSDLSAEKQAELDAITALGATVEYRKADSAEQQAVNGLVQSIVADFGHLHGVIHSAGVIADSFIAKKTPDSFSSVLAPKVAGTVCLDEASADLPLDVFVLFSSASAISGNPGQADYAAANGFMDAYADYRNSLV